MQTNITSKGLPADRLQLALGAGAGAGAGRVMLDILCLADFPAAIRPGGANDVTAALLPPPPQPAAA